MRHWSWYFDCSIGCLCWHWPAVVLGSDWVGGVNDGPGMLVRSSGRSVADSGTAVGAAGAGITRYCGGILWGLLLLLPAIAGASGPAGPGPAGWSPPVAGLATAFSNSGSGRSRPGCVCK